MYKYVNKPTYIKCRSLFTLCEIPLVLFVVVGMLLFSGTLEGKRERPGFRELIDDPLLRFSGICQESSSDLLVTCQVYADGRKLVLPVQTSYKAFSKRWKLVH